MEKSVVDLHDELAIALKAKYQPKDTATFYAILAGTLSAYISREQLEDAIAFANKTKVGE
jgi:hypothetical protein